MRGEFVELKRALRRNNGNLVHTARELLISRRQMYRLVYRAGLWQEVDEMRKALPPEIARILESNNGPKRGT